jgi:hypothetical protein
LDKEVGVFQHGDTTGSECTRAVHFRAAGKRGAREGRHVVSEFECGGQLGGRARPTKGEGDMALPRDVRGADSDDDALVYVTLRTTPVNGSSPRQNWMVFAMQNDENVWK